MNMDNNEVLLSYHCASIKRRLGLISDNRGCCHILHNIVVTLGSIPVANSS